MIRSKLGLLGLCAMVLGVMAISASAAQAAGSWLILPKGAKEEKEAVEVKEVGGKVNLLATLTGKIEGESATLLTHLVSLSVSVTCTAFTTTGIGLEPEGKLSEGGKVVFTGCKVKAVDKLGKESAPCTVKSTGQPTGTIASEEGKGEAVLHTFKIDEPGKVELKEVLTKIEPKGEAFATIKFEGSECLLPASNKVTGKLFVKDCQGFAETLKVEHLIEQGPLTSLSVGADTVEHLETSIDGSALVKLTGEPHEGLEWKAMGV